MVCASCDSFLELQFAESHVTLWMLLFTVNDVVLNVLFSQLTIPNLHIE